MSKKKQRGNKDKSKDKNKPSAGHAPAGQTAAPKTPKAPQTPTRPPLARVPRSRPIPVDSVQIDRPDPDSAPYAGAAARISVYSEWLNSPPPEIPAWLTGASEPMAAVRAAPAPAEPAPAPPRRNRKPTTRRKNASAPAQNGAVLLERTPTVSLDLAASPSLGTSPESSALPRTRTRRSTAARRLTAAQRAAMETIAPVTGPTATAAAAATTATARDAAQMRAAPAPAAARVAPAEPAATATIAARPPSPSPIEIWRTARTSSRSRATPASPAAASPPMPTVAPSAAPAAPAAPHVRPAPAAPATPAHVDPAAPHDAADDWLLNSGVGPATAREPSSRASAFLTAEPTSPVVSAFAATMNAPAAREGGKAGEAGRTTPPTTLGQTASRVAIPRSPSGAPSLPAALAATGGRLPAVQQSRPTDIAGAAAGGATQPPASTLLIHGARNPQPTSPVVPRRNRPHSLLAQVFVAVVCIAVLFAALTITSPLGYGAALNGTFQAYANSVAWIPTATPTPKPPVYAVSSGGGNIAPPSPAQQVVINEIDAVFGTYANGALGVARCESGYVASARNPYAVGNSHAEGVFQILYPSTWDTTLYAGDNPYDYVANIHAAFQIFQRDGYSWREWQCQP